MCAVAGDRHVIITCTEPRSSSDLGELDAKARGRHLRGDHRWTVRPPDAHPDAYVAERHVVAQIGVAAPRTKTNADGRLTDDATIAEIERLTAVLVDAPTLDAAARLERVRTVVAATGVDIGRIAQPASRRLTVPASAPAYSGAVIKTASDLPMRLHHAVTTGTGVVEGGVEGVGSSPSRRSQARRHAGSAGTNAPHRSAPGSPRAAGCFRER